MSTKTESGRPPWSDVEAITGCIFSTVVNYSFRKVESQPLYAHDDHKPTTLLQHFLGCYPCLSKEGLWNGLILLMWSTGLMGSGQIPNTLVLLEVATIIFLQPHY